MEKSVLLERIKQLEQEIKDKDEYMKVFESEFKRLIEKEKKYAHSCCYV